jgi:hypothetical protein
VSPTTALFRLIAVARLRARFAVSETVAVTLRPGDAVIIRVESLALTMTARVLAIAPEVDAAADLVFVEALVEVPPSWDHRLPSGTACHVALKE